jgi:Putative transmembrane family 234
MGSDANPGLVQYVIGYLLVGIAWGFTTPFMRRAAKNQKPQAKESPRTQQLSWAKRIFLSAWYSIVNLIKQPAYTIPLLINLSGSVIFFLIVGQAGIRDLESHSNSGG